MAKGKKSKKGKKAKKAKKSLVTAKKKSAKKSSKKAAKKSAKRPRSRRRKPPRSPGRQPRKNQPRRRAPKSVRQKRRRRRLPLPPPPKLPHQGPRRPSRLHPSLPHPSLLHLRRLRHPSLRPPRHQVGLLPVLPQQAPHRHGDTRVVRRARHPRTATTTTSRSRPIPRGVTFQRPQRPTLRPFFVRAILPRIAIRVRRHSDSVGWSAPQQSPALCPKCAPTDSKWVKIVVGMQHPPTTFHGRARTPKKSAHACLFCFTQAVARSRL